MDQVIANPVFRIAIGAIVATYAKPYVLNKVLIAELSPADEARNVRVTVATTAAITAFAFVALGMLVKKGGAA